ncbi:MAG: DUF1738 domain-containing protein [Alphaproteobacteria bacterium]|nr:DUF1738 domain-containing protein [Alphaproteobacteria bacterium]
MASYKNYAEDIAARIIIDRLEAGTAPWQKPWRFVMKR